MRASRLVSVLLLLQTRGRMTAQQLASTLEVSVRTIYRDMDALSAAGVPVYGDAGPDGGYQLLGGYRTRLNGLTAAEAQALSLAGMPAAAAELGLGTVLATAQLKLASALPEPLRDRAAAIGERFHLDAPGWYQESESAPLLAAVAGAVWEQRRITVRYSRWAAPTEVTRTLDPHGIVMKSGKWYLVARAAAGQEATGQAAPDGPGSMRTYRISQILGLTVLEETFGRQPGFDLTAYWQSSVAAFRAGLQHGEATVRLSAEGRRLLRGSMGPDVATAIDDAVAASARVNYMNVRSADIACTGLTGTCIASTDIADAALSGAHRAGTERDGTGLDGTERDGTGPDRDGWITVVVPIESQAHAQAEFLRLGADIEVLAPQELRDRMAAVVSSLSSRYSARR